MAEQVRRVVIEADRSQWDALDALAALATESGLRAYDPDLAGDVAPEELARAEGLSEISEVPKEQGTVNWYDFQTFARTTEKYHRGNATRAWTAICHLNRNQRYGPLLVFSGPIVEPSPFNIPGWKMPRDVSFDSLATFLNQAVADIAEGRARDYGLNGHRQNPVAGTTFEFIGDFVAYALALQNEE